VFVGRVGGHGLADIPQLGDAPFLEPEDVNDGDILRLGLEAYA
jgi:hypothetical protein